MPTREKLKELQNLTLERKILITQTRIIECYLKFDGKVYVSFSGGKDSTVLVDIARKIYTDIDVVFINTGLEYPEIVKFVKTFNNIKVLKPKMRFDEVVKKYGYPVVSKQVANVVCGARKNSTIRKKRLNGTLKDNHGNKSQFNCEKWEYLLKAPFKISDQCCNVMKKQPSNEYAKKSGKIPITGMMASESTARRNAWLKTGCNAFDLKKPQSQPMAFWTDQDVLHYIKKYDLPYCSVYGDIVPKSEVVGQTVIDRIETDLITTGCQRTGCMFCMFGAHLEKCPNRFQQMKETHPQQYDYCIREENGLGIGKVLDYIGVKY